MPEQLQWSEAEAQLVLQAIKTVGTASGALPLAPITLEMMEAIQNHVLHSEIDLQDLEIVAPAACPTRISSQIPRRGLSLRSMTRWGPGESSPSGSLAALLHGSQVSPCSSLRSCSLGEGTSSRALPVLYALDSGSAWRRL